PSSTRGGGYCRRNCTAITRARRAELRNSLPLAHIANVKSTPLERDEFGLSRSGHFSLAPFLRGEGWGEGLLPQILVTKCVRGESPSPGLLCNPTSPRKRGEVIRADSTQ